MRHPNLEVFVSQVEEDLFKLIDRLMKYSNLTKEKLASCKFLGR